MKSASIVLAILLLLMSSSILAQEPSFEPDTIVFISIESYSFDLLGSGARAEGMGKAFLAVSDDASAGTWNPAGLNVHDRPKVSIGQNKFIPRGSFSTSGPGLFVETLDHSGSFGSRGTFSFLAPIRIKGQHFVGSISFGRSSDEYDAFAAGFEVDSLVNAIDPSTGLVILDTLTTDINTFSQIEGGINTVNIAFGTRLYKTLSFGLALNIYGGKTVRESVVDVFAPDFPVFFGQRAAGSIVTTVIDTNKFSGVNFTLGLRLEGEKLDAGLIIRTPFSLTSKTDRARFRITQLNGQTFGELTDTTYWVDILVRYSMPIVIGSGVAYRPTESSMLSLDVEYRNFASASLEFRNRLLINSDGSLTEFLTEDTLLRWNSVFTVRVGGEKFFSTGLGRIPIRAGFGVVPMPNPDVQIDGTQSTPIKYNFAVGSGIWWNQIHFDAAYTYSTLDRDFEFLGELNNRNHHFNLTFTGYF